MRIRLLSGLLIAALLLQGVPAQSWGDEKDSVRTGQSHGLQYPSLYHTDPIRTAVLNGVDLASNDRFAEAETLFVHLAEEYPTSAIGPLFVAATIHAEMLDRESPARYPEFTRWLRRAHYLANEWKIAEPGNGEPEFLLGTAEGYDAVYESRWGGWFAALKKGLRSRNRFVAALEKDSTLVDALIGIGNYDYWKADRTDFINWLPIIPDNRQKGLDELSRAADSGVVCKAAARGSLVLALMNEGRYEDALVQADSLRLLAPEGKAALWMKALANYQLYRWDEALSLYRELAARIQSEGPGNHFNLIECAYYEAQCLFGAGRYAESAEACHRALAYPAERDVQDRQRQKLEELRDLQKRLKKLLAKS